MNEGTITKKQVEEVITNLLAEAHETLNSQTVDVVFQVCREITEKLGIEIGDSRA